MNECVMVCMYVCTVCMYVCRYVCMYVCVYIVCMYAFASIEVIEDSTSIEVTSICIFSCR